MFEWNLGPRIPGRRYHSWWKVWVVDLSGRWRMIERIEKSASGLGAAIVMALLAMVGASGVSAQQGQDGPFIRVNGSATVIVSPDRAHISFAVETQAKTAQQAAEENATLMDAVIQALRGSGTEGLRIETSGYSLNPVYTRPEPNRPPRIEEYRATNYVRLEVSDLEAVGGLLDLGVGAGANRIANLAFAASDTEDARLEAVAQAVLMARAEATAAAAASGVQLGPVLEIQVNSQVPMANDMRMRAGVAFEAAPPTPIEAAGLQVSANVTIRYGLGG